jgi:hypothetical protein
LALVQIFGEDMTNQQAPKWMRHPCLERTKIKAFFEQFNWCILLRKATIGAPVLKVISQLDTPTFSNADNVCFEQQTQLLDKANCWLNAYDAAS